MGGLILTERRNLRLQVRTDSLRAIGDRIHHLGKFPLLLWRMFGIKPLVSDVQRLDRL